MKDATITIRVNSEILDKFKTLCEENGISYSEVIRLLILDTVNRKGLNLRLI